MSFKIIYSWGEGQGVIDCHDDHGADSTVAGYEVIWDERKNGPLPANIDPQTVSLVNGRLVEDKAKISAKHEASAALAKKAEEERAEAEECRYIKDKLKAGTASSSEISKILIHLIDFVGDPYFDSAVDNGGRDAGQITS